MQKEDKGSSTACLSSAMDADWDLQAVVRGCTYSASVTQSACSSSSGTLFGESSVKSEFSSVYSSYLSFGGEQATGKLCSFPDPFEGNIRSGVGELHELFRPFFPKTQPFSFPHDTPLSILSPLSTSTEPPHLKQPAVKPHGIQGTAGTNSQTSRSKRRKNQLKKICHVPADALSSDIWAWRKYGQKPIKGSPFPRGYYRCSSSKGCLARKQVERNRSDPKMFIVTYTAEHNHPAPTHRNSLAGSTRQKTFTPQTTLHGDYEKGSSATPQKPFCSSPVTSLDDEHQPSNNTESREDKEIMDDDEVEQEEDFRGFPDETASDDFFAGLEEFTTVAGPL